MSISVITSVSGITDQGSVNYNIYAPVGTNVPNGTVISVPGIGGLTLTLTESSGNGITYTAQDATPTPPGWIGNFFAGSPCLHTQFGNDEPASDNGPLTWVISGGIAGFGCYIQANFYGAFTANIKAYDVSNVLLGSFNVNGNSNGLGDGSSIFVGVLSSANDIRKIIMDVPVATHNAHDFAVTSPKIFKVAASTGQIIVSKTTDVDDPDAEFIVTMGGGLDPSTFVIRNGEQFTYTDIVAGTGFSCTEGGQCGWELDSITTSNGTSSNFAVVAGEQTTVDIANIAVPIVPGENGCASITSQRRLIRRLRRSPHLANQGKWLFVHNFELWMQTGVGLSAGDGQGADPQVHLRISRDGGMTWGPSIPVSAGKLGQYRARAIWRQLGQARDLVFEVTVSDPVAWSIVQAYVDLTPGVS